MSQVFPPKIDPNGNSNPAWLNPPSKLAKFRSSDTLPHYSDVVVVGSGLSGCFFSLSYLEKNSSLLSYAKSPKTITLLEARDICSGASGRNGGHIAPDFYSFVDVDLFKNYDETNKKIQNEIEYYLSRNKFEYENYKSLEILIQKYNIDCETEFKPDNHYRAYFSQESFNLALTQLKILKKCGWDTSILKIYKNNEAAQKIGIPSVVGLINGPGSSISSYKLVTSLFLKLIDNGLQIHANTPVISIEKADFSYDNDQDINVNIKEQNENFHYLVKTNRGTILTPNVVLTTNAFLDTLLFSKPNTSDNDFNQLKNALQILKKETKLITPVQGQVMEVTVDSNFITHFSHASSFTFDTGDAYLIKRNYNTNSNDCTKKNYIHFVLGGFRQHHPLNGINVIDDNNINKHVHEKLKNFLHKVLFSGCNEIGTNSLYQIKLSDLYQFGSYQTNLDSSHLVSNPLEARENLHINENMNCIYDKEKNSEESSIENSYCKFINESTVINKLNYQSKISSLNLEDVKNTERHEPNFKVEYKWTGTMGYSKDSCPFIGRLHPPPNEKDEVLNTGGIFTSSGFTGHGVPRVYLAAKALASIVCGSNEETQIVPNAYKTYRLFA